MTFHDEIGENSDRERALVSLHNHWREKASLRKKSLGAISYFESILKAYDRGTGK